MKMTLALISLIVFSGTLASAKCRINRADIERFAPTDWSFEGDELNTALVNTGLRSKIVKGKTTHIADYEAYIRPDYDDAFQVLPLPLFMVQMEKKKDAIYICAHVDTGNPANSETVVYFLSYNRIHPITPMPLPIKQIANILTAPMENTPLIVTKVPLSILARAQTIFMHIFGGVTKIGVDRVRITDKEIQFFSGGDRTRFDNAMVTKPISLK